MLPVLASALFATVGASAARAAPLTVTRTDDPAPGACNPGDCSLREAVIAANNRGGPDTIRLAVGTYTLAQPRPSSGDFGFAQVGDLDVGESLKIVGPPRSPASGAGGGLHATIDGNGATVADRVFEIDSGASVTMHRLRIVGGEAQKTDDANSDGTPDFARGGAIRIDSGATLDLDHILLSSNTANSFGQGGAIYNAGTLRVADTRLTLNDAVDGFSGAIHTDAGATTSLTRSIAEANKAAFGGALGAYGINVVDDSALIANHAGIGGAIRAGGGNSLVSLTNSTLAHNDSTGSGSAIRARDGSGLIFNSVTIARNTADVDATGDGDAAISLRRDTLATTAELHNTILAANEDDSPGGEAIPDCQVTGGASILLAGYDLLGDRHGCSYSLPLGAEGNQLPGSGFTVDPGLAAAVAANGGPTPTLALLRESPAVNAGDPALPGAGPACPAAGQRGAPRTRCDIGAYELRRCRGTVVDLVGRPGHDVLVGGPAADGVLALTGADTARTGGGDDAVCAGPGRDVVQGGRGADRLKGGKGPDVLRGGRGHDVLNGGPGQDICRGGPGRDTRRGCER